MASASENGLPCQSVENAEIKSISNPSIAHHEGTSHLQN